MGRDAIQHMFEQALRQHATGGVEEAEALYRTVLEQEPGHAGATHYLGVIAHQRGRDDVAVQLMRQSLAMRPDWPDALNNLGNALRSGGRMEEAIEAYRRAIALRPGYARALDNLGGALEESGRLDEAIAALRQAIELQPDAAEVHCHVGDVLKKARRLDEAIAAYRQAIVVRPEFPEAFNNLGNALRDAGRVEEAIGAYRQAIALRPVFAEASNNLGNALRDCGRIEEAIAAFGQAIAKRDDFPEAHNNLANALRDRGQFQEAIAAYRRGIALRQDFAEAYCNLGLALRDDGRVDEALAALVKASELKPGWGDPLLNLGHLYREQGQFNEAAAAYRQAAKCEATDRLAHSFLAAALADLQEFDEAEKSLAHAVAADPDSPWTHWARGMLSLRRGHGAEAVSSFRRMTQVAPGEVSSWTSLGEALRQVGQFEEAADCFTRALAVRPGAVQAYTLMASIGATPSAPEMAAIRAGFADARASMRLRAHLGFVLGKIADQEDRFDDAFDYYAQANALMLEMRRAAGASYSCAAFTRQVDEAIAGFTRAHFERVRGWGLSSELPVFIVGMPRSGTTLVEQIIASHPDAFGAGELVDIGKIAPSLTPDRMRYDQINKIAHAKLASLRSLGGSAQRVTDKMPGNVEWLGLIATLFPAARVIFCRRDPRDTCLSCFFQPFNNGSLFSFDLGDCGRHHVQTDRLIEHWLSVLPVRMLQVQYEEVVGDLEGQSRRIIEFLGLPWHPACVDFHRTQRTVQTASDWQVRQPIYTRSVGRWRKYERHLGALMRAL